MEKEDLSEIMRQHPFLAGLSLSAFGQALRGLPPLPRRLALGAVYAVLASAAPRTMEIAAKAMARTPAATPELVRAMAEDLALRSRAASRERFMSVADPSTSHCAVAAVRVKPPTTRRA